MSIEELKKLWEEFADIPIDDNDNIEIGFMNFPAGTNRFDIWHWFDNMCPNGLVVDLYNK